MTDEELSRALSILRTAARAEGHKAEISNNLDTLILFALRHAERQPESADEVRAAIHVVRKWNTERAARGKGPRN